MVSLSKPLDGHMVLVCFPFTFTWQDTVEMHASIKTSHLFLKPLFLKDPSKKSHSTQSWAFCMSIFRAHSVLPIALPFLLLVFRKWNNSWAMMMLSCIFRPVTNAL